MCPVVNSIFDDVIRKILISVKIFLYILKTYKMVYIMITFRDFSISQLEIKVVGG